MAHLYIIKYIHNKNNYYFMKDYIIDILIAILKILSIISLLAIGVFTIIIIILFSPIYYILNKLKIFN